MFSIIVPVYNVEKYIAECIESVLNQSFGDYELILVDDGSTDKSLQICKEYAQRNADKIKLFHKENEGLLLTRRYGLKMSNGEYVVFLDSDDCLRNNALEELNRVIKNKKYDVIQFNGSRKADFSIPFMLYKKAGGEWTGEYVRRLLCGTDSLNNMCLKCIKRSVIDIDADYTEFKTVRRGEDLLQMLPIADCANTFYYLDKILYYYRLNTESITGVTENVNKEEIAAVSRQLEKYAKKWGISEETVKIRMLKHYIVLAKAILRSPTSFKHKKDCIKKMKNKEHYLSCYSLCSKAGLSIKDRIVAKIINII